MSATTHTYPPKYPDGKYPANGSLHRCRDRAVDWSYGIACTDHLASMVLPADDPNRLAIRQLLDQVGAIYAAFDELYEPDYTEEADS